MTVRYTAKLATNTSLGCFTKLLFRWRGSVYKLIWAEYLVFIILYYFICLIYRFGLNGDQQKLFEKVVNYCEKSGGSLEMSFVLGFFVSSIVAKWWQLYNTIPWPDPVALFVNCSIRGNDESIVQLKRRIVRYCNLNLILTFRTISPPFKKRFPTLNHLIKDGLLTDEEQVILENLEKEGIEHPTEWLPITWASELTMKAACEGRISSDFACQKILEELDKFRHGCTLLLEYEHCSVPLVYIQVVTIAVYTYFLSCLMGSQWLIRDSNLEDLDLYFPFFTTLQFIFYMGWLKVAESLVNPFGCDDDDFELDDIVERHLQVTYMMVSSGKGKCSSNNQKAMTKHHYVNLEFREYNGESTVQTSSNALKHDNLQEPRMVSPPPKFSDVVTIEEDEEQSHNVGNQSGIPVQSEIRRRLSVVGEEEDTGDCDGDDKDYAVCVVKSAETVTKLSEL